MEAIHYCLNLIAHVNKEVETINTQQRHYII